MIGSIRVGHAQDHVALTGCTVFLPPEGTVASCEVRGGAPGTRETELMKPLHTVRGVNAVILTGGSAFGLQAAGGVVRYLEERREGFPTPGGPVPIVSSGVIFDLDFGDSSVRPDEEMAYLACDAAGLDEESEGNVGVGTGATAGNVAGRKLSTKSGFGLCRHRRDDFKLEVAAVANPLGEVVDEYGEILAGARDEAGGFLKAEEAICRPKGVFEENPRGNTTLVVIATNARMDVESAARVALQGHNGIARAIRPSHTRYDGDTVFVLCTGEVDASPDEVEVMAAIGTCGAIRSGVLNAKGAGGVPAACDILKKEDTEV